MIDCRGDFPILATSIHGKDLIYLDTAATAQKPTSVIETINSLHRECNANVHRAVHTLSDRTTRQYEEARAKIARFVGARSQSEIIMTSGATASLNLAAASLGEILIREGDNVVVSRMEHHSNIVPWQMQCKKRRAELRVIEIDEKGELIFDPAVIDAKTKVVAICEASNVLGTMPDLKSIIARARQMGAVSVVDGCQGVVHGGVNVEELGCDFYAFSGHKLYGPTGIGVLYGRSELLEQLEPWQGGGDMIASVSLSKGSTWAEIPLKFEAGTQNFIGAIGLGAAIDYISQFSVNDIRKHETMLYEILSHELQKINGLRIYGTSIHKSPMCSFTIDGTEPVDLAMIVDKMGVAVRSGQLCAEPTMEHYSVRTMCRASLGIYNTEQDCIKAAQAIHRAATMLR